MAKPALTKTLTTPQEVALEAYTTNKILVPALIDPVILAIAPFDTFEPGAVKVTEAPDKGENVVLLNGAV